MRAYRVAKSEYSAFDGRGAGRVGGRWNSPGRRVIYCGGSYAVCLLEILVHANLRRLPGPHVCAVIDVPEELSIEALKPAELPAWDAPDLLASRGYGDRWLEEARTAVLVVPSLVARPFERNVLVNPAHPDAARLAVSDPIEVTWDARLFTV